MAKGHFVVRRLERKHGMEVVRRAKEISPDLSIIVVTALLETTNAIDAMRQGRGHHINGVDR